VFQAHVGQYNQLFTINPDGTASTQLTRITFSGDTEGAEQASWSPDAATIAFDGPSADRVNVFSINSDGSGLKEIPLPAGFNGAPAYSPDGTRIAFDHDGKPGVSRDHGIWIANADGTNAHRVTTGIRTVDAFDTDADWSPDGKRLSFTRVKDTSQAAVFVVAVDGKGLRRLTPWKLDASGASWSPDGRLVFSSYFDDRPGESGNVFVTKPGSATVTQLTHFAGGATHAKGPSWSPDGKQIVWHRVGKYVNELFVMDARGQHMRQVTHMPLTANPSHADWAAN
jgi:Tol biopolymer transport system component